MHSPACIDAMRRLQSVDDPSSSAATGRAPAQLLLARRQAATACLGVAALSQPPRVGQLQAPQSVPSVNAAVRSHSGVPGTGPLPSTPAVVPGLTSVTTCDANGCWSSDGTRLTRLGPAGLLGPRGLCTTTGAVLNCP